MEAIFIYHTRIIYQISMCHLLPQEKKMSIVCKRSFVDQKLKDHNNDRMSRKEKTWNKS